MNRWTARNPLRHPERAWVGARGSLTAWLVATGRVFSVEVLQQGRQRLHRSESQALNLRVGCAGYAREVMLRLDGEAVVFARSVTAQVASKGPWRSLRGLGTRPLAEILFSHLPVTRSPLAFSRLKPASPLQRDVVKSWRRVTGASVRAGALPARRSVFKRAGAPLLVMEVFAAPSLPWGLPSPCRRRGATDRLPSNLSYPGDSDE